MTKIGTSTEALRRYWNPHGGGVKPHDAGLLYLRSEVDAVIAALAAENAALRADNERLRGVLTKLEYWMDTDEDILAAMNDWDRSDHLEKLSMIRATLKGAANG